MTDISKHTQNNNSEKRQIFDNNKENKIISDTINTKENSQEKHKEDPIVKNKKGKKDNTKQKDITSNTQPEIEVNGTYRIPWGIIGGILILVLIGIAIYINNTTENSENTQQDTTQSTSIE